MTERRGFIKQSLIGAAGAAIGGMGFTAKSYASIRGSNDRINLALIGIRNQGGVHIDAFCKLKDSHNVRIKTLCDTDEALFAPASKAVSDKSGVKPLTEWDMKKVFDDKEIDAVSIVIPNHWHALATIWACQAGKHVYIEKPAMHNIWEGRKMVEAARKYERLVQVGLNNRSIDNVREAIKFLHDGGIGEVYMARGICFKARDSYGMAKDSEPPATLHYDRWLGPAAYRPYNEKKGHYNWHWYWDTGNGDIGNTGPHQLDIARWGLNKNEHPISIYSSGGIYGFNKDSNAPKTPGVMVYGGVENYGHDRTTQETPNIQTATMRYEDDKIIEYEVRNRYTNGEGSLNIGIGNLFFGEDGYLELNGDTWKAFRKRETKPFAGSGKSKDNGTEHWANFLDALRSGKISTLRADINDGFYSSALPLLANISYRLKKELQFMGGNIDMEKFVNDPAADAMLTRAYRPPYVVPNEV
ncbi:MAG TPA: Gfo/Idh/MocA family oxidoreductase [Flavitalea sp.]|nr:Gfo/Idh/MocA family oxidoreductase [Flavitalea sp.]